MNFNRFNTCIFLIFFSVPFNGLRAQSLIGEVEKIFTPSPTVNNLGTFGNTNIKKSTGAITKSIPLFSLTNGDITYSPSLQYFSAGVRVDEWGGRTGIGWSDDFTCLISREVRSVPDERSTGRIDL